MKIPLRLICQIKFFVFLAIVSSLAIAQESEQIPLLIHAARVFDGNSIRTNTSVLVTGGIVTRIDTREAFKSSDAKVIDLGDA